MDATGILIDPENHTVTTVRVKGDYREIYHMINASTFAVAPIKGDGDGIFVDDNGMFKVDKAVWYTDLYPEPLIGKGLILGSDEEGNSISPVIDIETVRASIQWTEKGETYATIANKMRIAKGYGQ